MYNVRVMVHGSPYFFLCIIQVFKRWLEETVEQLQHIENPKRRFISSVCIAYWVKVCYVYQLEQDTFLYPLVKMLRIEVDPTNKSCSNVTYLFDITTEQSR